MSRPILNRQTFTRSAPAPTGHKFSVGQTVRFMPAARTMADRQVRVNATDAYIVSRLLPFSGPSPQYRIKSTAGQERVVAEEELSNADEVSKDAGGSQY